MSDSTTETNNGTIVDTTATIDRLQGELSNVTASLQSARNDLQAATTQLSRLRSDIDTIGEKAIEIAEQRGWCSEYDNMVDEINGHLSYIELPVRERDFDVSVTVTATYYTSVSVRARSEDDAKEMVEHMDSGDVMANQSYSSPDDQDWEVTDVQRS